MRYKWKKEEVKAALKQWMDVIAKDGTWGNLTFLAQDGEVVTIKMEETFKPKGE